MNENQRGSRLPQAPWAALMAALLALSTLGAAAQTTEYFLVSKGRVFSQSSTAAPSMPATKAAIFDAEAFGYTGPPLVTAGTLTLPSQQALALSFASAGDTYQFLATNDTLAELDLAFPAGNYQIALTSSSIPGLKTTIALPADNFPVAPRLDNFTAAQAVDQTKDFILVFEAFTGAGTHDDATLNLYENGSVAFTPPLLTSATNATIPANSLTAGTTYDAVLRFRTIQPGATGLATPASGFFSETHFPLTTLAAGATNPPPALTNAVPSTGQILADPAFVLQFNQPMDQTKVSIQWSASINGANVPFSAANFVYQWSDARTLICLYGSTGQNWPAGALISWALNPTSGAASDFASTAGIALASGTFSGSFLTSGGPWACVAQINSPFESPAFYLVKAANNLQSSDHPSVPDSSLGAQFLAYLETASAPAGAGGSSSPPLAIVVPPESAGPGQGLDVLSLGANPGHLVYTYAASSANSAALDAAFPAGEYVLELAVLNPANSQSPPIPTNSASLFLTNAAYPPAPQFTNAAVIPPSTVTNGLTVDWSPWTGAGGSSFVSFEILDPGGNVVFSAPNSCAGLPLTPSSGSVAVPPNLLSNGVPYQMVLSFNSLSDPAEFMPGLPGQGYAALASVTRMGLLAYLSSRPLPPPPLVTITTPVSGAFLPSGVVTVQITAAQTNGFLAGLQLFSGTNLLTSLPLAAGLTNYTGTISGSASPGPQNLFVVATDGNGQTTTAGPVPIMAQSPGFTVALSSPGNGAAYPPFPTIPLAATASSPNGAVTNVEFFMDGNPIASLSAPPYLVSVPQTAPGQHQFYAHAFDALGFGGASATVSVTVAATANNRLAPFFSTNGAFSAGFAGTAGSNYVLEAATNLAPPVQWTPVQTKRLSGAQSVFSDAAFGQFPARYYRIVTVGAAVSNAPAFSVWGLDNPQATGSDTFDVEGAFVALTQSNGMVFNLSIPPGAMGLTQPVSMTAVTNLQDYPFAGPLVAAVDLAPAEYDLFVTATLTIQLPPGLPAARVAAFTYHEPNGELYLTPFTATNVVTGSVTNSVITIPVNRLGGYGLAALTAADLALVQAYPPSASADQFDQAVSLALLAQAGVPVPLARPKTTGGSAGPSRGARPADDPGLLAFALSIFDSIYPGMQAAAASGDYSDAQFASWSSWINSVYEAGLQDSLSIQITEFAQAIDAIYQVKITNLIQKADEQHDWQSIATLEQFDSSGKLNNVVTSLGWQPGQLQALQQALDECLTFEFDLDSLLVNDSDIGTEQSELKVQVTFNEGNPSTLHSLKGQAAPTWAQTDYPSLQNCSPVTASPSTPAFLMYGFNIVGTQSKDSGGHTIYNVTGIQPIFWPANPLENFATVCEGYSVTLPDYWWAEFGYLYEDDLKGFPSKHAQTAPGACFVVTDDWQVGGGGGNPVLATRNGSGEAAFSSSGSSAIVDETSTFTLKHTPQ